jgi:hypothetical protein
VVTERRDGRSGVHEDVSFRRDGRESQLCIYLVLQAVLLWQLGALARADSALARPLIRSFFVASLPIGLVSWAFLFPTPVYFDAALTACLAWATLM